jgi:FKBP-type peptidyl-prolyl cis-trans isomerase
MTGIGREEAELPDSIIRGIQTMLKGEHAKFIIESNYGYGEKGNEKKSLLGNEDLIYDVQLNDFDVVCTFVVPPC